jgi:hypothetical protein
MLPLGSLSLRPLQKGMSWLSWCHACNLPRHVDSKSSRPLSEFPEARFRAKRKEGSTFWRDGEGARLLEDEGLPSHEDLHLAMQLSNSLVQAGLCDVAPGSDDVTDDANTHVRRRRENVRRGHGAIGSGTKS